MATTEQLNAVFDALEADIHELSNDLVPSFLQNSVNAQITKARVLKLVTDAVKAFENSAPHVGGIDLRLVTTPKA